jgi:hypothetical protein
MRALVKNGPRFGFKRRKAVETLKRLAKRVEVVKD